ncbi:MAG: hypothetical protein AAF570_15065, partial [Bacteroidota bacterium]
MSKKRKPVKSQDSLLPEGWQQKAIASLVVIITGLIIIFSYFGDGPKKNNVLMQQDILQHRGAAKEIMDFRKKTKGEEALWTSRVFSGMPAFQISTRYPNNLFKTVDDVLKLRDFGVAHPIGHFFVLFLGMFVLLLTLKIDPVIAAVGAFGFLMSSYFFIVMEAGHNSKVSAISYTPLVIAGILMIYRGRYWMGAALTAFFMGLEINANHFQITYYMMFIVGCFVVSEYFRSVSNGPKAVLGILLGTIPLLWIAAVPSIGWMGVVLLVYLMPMSYELFMASKSGDLPQGSIGKVVVDGLIKGKEIGGNVVKLRKFHIASGIAIFAMIMAMLPNLGRLTTTNEYAKETIRGGTVLDKPLENMKAKEGLTSDYAYQWSYGVGETFTLLNPNYMGGASNSDVGEDSETHDILTKAVGKSVADQLVKAWPTYYGTQPFTSGPVYVGAIICFLFVLGLIVVPGRYRWWLLAATILGITLSWGKNWIFYSDLFFNNFPLYNRFRAVSMMLVIAEITMPILAALGLYYIFQNPRKLSDDKIIRYIGIAAGVTVGIALILVVSPIGVNDFATEADGARIGNMLRRAGMQSPDPRLVAQLSDALVTDRQALYSSGMMNGIVYILLAAGACFGYVNFIKERFTGD